MSEVEERICLILRQDCRVTLSFVSQIQAARHCQDQTVVGINTFDLGSPVSVAECQFGTRLQTGIYVQFQVSVDELTGEIMLSIQDALFQSIARLYQTSETVCDPEFRIVNDVEATAIVNVRFNKW